LGFETVGMQTPPELTALSTKLFYKPSRNEECVSLIPCIRVNDTTYQIRRSLLGADLSITSRCKIECRSLPEKFVANFDTYPCRKRYPAGG
jgi:hypothetical protein